MSQFYLYEESMKIEWNNWNWSLAQVSGPDGVMADIYIGFVHKLHEQDFSPVLQPLSLVKHFTTYQYKVYIVMWIFSRLRLPPNLFT